MRLTQEVAALHERRRGVGLTRADWRRLQDVVRFIGAATDDELPTPQEALDLALAVSDLRRGLLALRTGSSASGRTLRFKVVARRGFEHDSGSERARAELSRALERTLSDRRARVGVAASSAAVGSWVSLPLEADGELLGAIVLEDPRRPALTSDEERLVRGLGRSAALALRRRVRRREERIPSGRLARAPRPQTSELLVCLPGRDRRPSEEARAEAIRALEPPTEPLPTGRRAARDAAPTDRWPGQGYAEAKRDFTRRYLREALRHARGDLRRTSELTGLPPARLIALLQHLDLDLVAALAPGPGRPDASWIEL